MTDVGLDHLKTVADAIAVLDATDVRPAVESVPLADADGRVLAAAVLVDRDTPPFDKALMDGYAVVAASVGVGRTLRCVGEVAAGGTASAAPGAGECTAIMTGAPLPPGADAVVPVERTSRVGDDVTFSAAVKPGDAVAPRAAEARAGDVALPTGVRLGPAGLAVCAQVGAGVVRVFARPRVGVLSTGDEVIAYDRTPAGPQVRNGNTPMLAALVRRYGGEVVDLGHACDDPAAIAAKLAAPGLDVVLVTGGMSMGVYDYTPRVLRDLGYDLAVTKLKIKPGKPFVFAKTPPAAAGGGAPFVFGLPGNPVSAFVCTVRLVSRLLLRMGGASPEPAWETATLVDDLPANGPREFYHPVDVQAGLVHAAAWGGSADVFALARANALLVRPADQAPLPAGAVVAVLRLP